MYRAVAALAAEVRFFPVISVQVQAWKSVPQGLKRVCENYSLQMSPVGTAESSPGRESWVEVRETPSPAGTAENAPGCNPGVPPTLKWTMSDSGQPTPGEIGLAWDDCYSVHVWSSSPMTDVLGHSQPS